MDSEEFTKKYWIRCARILNISRETTINKLAKKMEYLKSSPHIHIILKFLEENNFIEIDKERYPFSIKINNKKLALFLRNSEIFNLCGSIIERTTPAYRY